MCGFTALIEPDRPFSHDLTERLARDLYHRGPDSGGIHQDRDSTLIFRRLAIMDPQAQSDQPMCDETGRYRMVFNGEIYNYQDLKKALSAEGVTFRTNGDTEVILRGFIQWGSAIVSRLEGMFAFVIWDSREKRAYAARDPLGIKPLYMAKKHAFLGFSSEARPLRRLVQSQVDPHALKELLLFRFAAGRLSNYAGIELVPGGTLVTYDLASGSLREERYCDPLTTLRRENQSNEINLKSIEAALLASVNQHLMSDVDYAVQLSGGVDSSLVTAMASQIRGKPLRTYGIRLEEESVDESPFRKMVEARYAIEHHEIKLTNRDFADALPRAVWHMDGPSPHFGCVFLMLLCDRIAQGDKVVLTGEGADEFFGGYARYGLWNTLKKRNDAARLAPRWLWDIPPFTRYRELKKYAHIDAAISSSIYFDIFELGKIFPDLAWWQKGHREEIALGFTDFRDRLMAVDQGSYLSSLLMRQDKMAMAASVEARVPFTHMPLARVVNRIPTAKKVPDNTTKPLLKKIAEKWLPKDLIYRRKLGLTLPLDEWLRDEKGLGRYLELLSEPNSRLANYGNRAVLSKQVENFRRSRPTRGLPPLAHLVNMELWLRSMEADEPNWA